MIRFKTNVFFFMVLSLGPMLSLSTAGGSHDHKPPKMAENVKDSAEAAVKTVDAYLEVMEKGSGDQATRLFLPRGGSHILENGKAEGTWENYLEHHLRPEMEHVKAFRYQEDWSSSTSVASAVYVEKVGHFEVDVDEQTLRYRVSLSALVVQRGKTWLISRLHWASRPVGK